MERHRGIVECSVTDSRGKDSGLWGQRRPTAAYRARNTVNFRRIPAADRVCAKAI